MKRGENCNPILLTQHPNLRSRFCAHTFSFLVNKLEATKLTKVIQHKVLDPKVLDKIQKKSARLRWSIGTGNRLCRREGGVCATALAAATFVVYQPPPSIRPSIHAIHAPMTLPVEISLHFLLSLPLASNTSPQPKTRLNLFQ